MLKIEAKKLGSENALFFITGHVRGKLKVAFTVRYELMF